MSTKSSHCYENRRTDQTDEGGRDAPVELLGDDHDREDDESDPERPPVQGVEVDEDHMEPVDGVPACSNLPR